MNKYRFGERVRYWFDNVMSRGLLGLIGLLGLTSLAFIAVVALIVVLFRLFPPDNDMSYPEAFWSSLLRTLDPGTMGGDQGAGYRIAMLIVTIGGLFLVASLIGIISNSFNERVESLRKGRSRVLESGHTVILGWSSKVVPIVQELCIANESERRPAIVILSERDKVEVEDELHQKISNRGRTRLIVRNGDPLSLYDLELVNPATAKSIIILPPDDAEDPDSIVIRSALAIINNPRRHAGLHHIVGELARSESLEVARLIGGNEADWVMSPELISRVTVQTSRQSGLSVVFTELLDFDGDEMYFTRQQSLVGLTYGDAQFHFEDASLMGLVTATSVEVNPPCDRIITADDQLIVIAEDDSSIRLSPPGTADTKVIRRQRNKARTPERTLVLGYNEHLERLLPELNTYVAKGSTVTVVAEPAPKLTRSFSNLKVTVRGGDTTNRSVLEDLKPHTFDHIVVLAYSDDMSGERADAKTLVTLLLLRDIAQLGGHNLNIVSEMMDDKNRQLAEVTNADDFIVSDKIVSLMLAQLSENPRLAEVFDALFGSDGSELCLRPAENYVALDTEMTFYSVVQSAQDQGHTAIGYRHSDLAHSSDDSYGVCVNPRKSDTISLSAGDKIIVLAEA